jgi:PBP1b-binding outer membrane lipoprotein LpoB
MKKTSLITTSLLLGAMLLSACSAAAQTPAYNSYSQDELCGISADGSTAGGFCLWFCL